MGWITQQTRTTDDGKRELALESKSTGAGEYRIRVDELVLARFTGARQYADAVFEGAATMLEGWLETIAEISELEEMLDEGLADEPPDFARSSWTPSEKLEHTLECYSSLRETFNDVAGQRDDLREQLGAVKERANGAEAALEELREYHDAAVERTHELAGTIHAARRRAEKAEELVERHRAEADKYRAALIKLRERLAEELGRVLEVAGVDMEDYTARAPHRLKAELDELDDVLGEASRRAESSFFAPGEIDESVLRKTALEALTANGAASRMPTILISAPDPANLILDDLRRAGEVIRENDGALPRFEPSLCQECGDEVGLGDSAAFGRSLEHVWCKACFLAGHYDEAMKSNIEAVKSNISEAKFKSQYEASFAGSRECAEGEEE